MSYDDVTVLENPTPSIMITTPNVNNPTKKVTPIQSCDTLVEPEDSNLIDKLDEDYEPAPTSELNVDTLKQRNLSKCGLVRFESTKDIHFSKNVDYDPYGNDDMSDEEEELEEEEEVIETRKEVQGEGEISKIASKEETSAVETSNQAEVSKITVTANNSSKKSEEENPNDSLVVFQGKRPAKSGFKPTGPAFKPGQKPSTLLETIAIQPPAKPSTHPQPMSVPLKTVTKTSTALTTLTTTTTLAVRPKSGLFEYSDNGDLLVDNIEFGTLETKPVQYKFNGELKTNWDRVKENTVDMLPSTSTGGSGGPGLVQRLIVKALLSPTRSNIPLPTKDQFYSLMTKIPRPLTIAFTSNGQSFNTLKLIEEDKERKRRSFRVKQKYFDNNEDWGVRFEEGDIEEGELKVVEMKELDKGYRPRVVV
ncbi:hypothetical protein CONCODRAFT_80720 [Conidiobolus coronatus NRRL 28638]|uniref:Uncharacterized protein n=1 Tax=Conidiobolus coronatus (strain ATCC 28846 / CBS 209.66 / NRRL 28638) TaxID=796925 RepID=A0A137NS80_CONC2|nr:hypothetical protein CONCODRAFT_80720 [Conidiobolus coronatus NRRL 28638]|eukprot:KXN65623.1 hypothetical protein CONCODRAFT_80720 [Conidiobolus coronatus NRRL 28638]